MLFRLQKAGLRINANKSSFALHEIEYLGYILTREGIKPQQDKVQAILALKEPTSVKELRKFLGMVQYYRDLWPKRSHLIAPLTDLIGECGETKVTRANKTKKKAWYWSDIHQEAFDLVKQTLARETMLSYPDYNDVFEIYTDASSRQLGAVITQKGKPLAFFSRKLNDAQQKYSVTELELLSIVECLKEFKGMLWGQRIKVFTDHKNLVRDALGLTCDRVYRWRLLLEEYEPEIVFIKGVDNIVADAISRLEYDPEINVKDINVHQKCLALAKLFNQTEQKLGGDDSNFTESYQQDSEIEVDTTSAIVDMRKDNVLQHIFATTTEEEDDIYPPTITEISITQRKNRVYKPYFSNKPFKKKDKKISLKLIDDTDVLVYQDTRLVIPGNAMQNRIITWYHHYLQHPGENRLEETLTAVIYWPGMRTQVRKYVKSCERCLKGK